MLIDNLLGARLNNPFDELGLVKNSEGGYVLRAWLPYSKKVVVRDLANTRDIAAMECVHKDGLYEAKFPDLKEPFNYSFNVSYPDAVVNVIDPYQFHDEAFAGLAEMKLDAANLYRTLGAHIVELNINGVTVKGALTIRFHYPFYCPQR